MRVLVITNLYPSPERPGYGTMIRSQVESLASAGVEAELLVIEGKRSRRAYLEAARTLRRRLREDRFDLVHAHYGYSGWIALGQRRSPVVMSFMGDDILGTRRSDGGLEPRSRLIAAANRVLARFYAAVIVKTEAMAERLAPCKAHVVPNGVDPDRFRPRDRAAARRALGLDADRVHVLFAADPAVAVKRYFLAEAAVAGLGDRWRLHAVHGRPQDELAHWMNACDALVLTSSSEGSPNVVKEAMACNLPVVATDVGDVRRLFDRASGNRLVTVPLRLEGPAVEEAAASLGAALAAVVETGPTRCRDAMEDLFLEPVARRLREVYEEALGGIPSGSVGGRASTGAKALPGEGPPP